jgi:hypothetical protein
VVRSLRELLSYFLKLLTDYRTHLSLTEGNSESLREQAKGANGFLDLGAVMSAEQMLQRTRSLFMRWVLW